MKILYLPNRYDRGISLQTEINKLGNKLIINGSCITNKKGLGRGKKDIARSYMTNFDILVISSDVILIETVLHGVIPSLIKSINTPIITYVKGDGINSINILKSQLPCMKPFYKKLHINLMKLSTGIIYASEYIKHEYIRNIPELKYKKDTIIPHAPTNKYSDLGTRNFNSKKIKLLTSSNFNLPDKAKSIHFLINCIKKLPSNYELEIAGGGLYLKKEMELCTSSQVKWLGQLAKRELNKKYNESHIFLYHSLNDACPTVVMESQLTGLPIIVTNRTSSSELVGKSGIIVNDNEQEMINAIIELSNNPLRMREIGVENKKFIKNNLNWTISAQKIDKFIKSVI